MWGASNLSGYAAASTSWQTTALQPSSLSAHNPLGSSPASDIGQQAAQTNLWDLPAYPLSQHAQSVSASGPLQEQQKLLQQGFPHPSSSATLWEPASGLSVLPTGPDLSVLSSMSRQQPYAAAGTDGMTVMQVQDAAQCLPYNGVTALQQAFLHPQALPSQDGGALPGCVPEGHPGCNSSSSPTFQPDTPVLAAPLIGNCASGSFCRQDSLSSSWHCLESLSSSNTSSPSFRMSSRSRLAATGLAPVASTWLMGTAGVQGLVNPDMQATNAELVNISGGMLNVVGSSQQDVLDIAAGGQQGMVVLNQSCWPVGSGRIPVPVSGLAGGINLVHGVPGGCLGQAGADVTCGLTYEQAGGLAAWKPAAAAGGGSMTARGCQRVFKGNKHFGLVKARGPIHAAAADSHTAATACPHGPAAQAWCEAHGEVSITGSARCLPAGPWADVTLEEGLKQLWSGEQLQAAAGGPLFNVQQLAWHPVGEPDPCPQDMYNFQKLKRMVQRLDAVHKTRVKLIKRIHAVADNSECNLKSVYREVRALIGEMLHDAAMQIKSLAECRVTGLVRLALMLQTALQLGPPDCTAAGSPKPRP